MTISVIIPCYNAASYLEQTLRSVLSQSRPPNEVILVDDGSTDTSIEVARRFERHIEIVSQENAGASAARNRAARLATGNALMFMDADDLLGPHALEGLSTALARAPEHIAVCPWYCLRQDDERWVRTRRNSPPRRHGLDDLAAWLTGWFHTPCSVLWSRAAFERTGFWDERVTVDDDGDMMMRAFIAGASLEHATFGAAYYRKLPEDETSLSDTGASRDGLRSRLYVLQKVGSLLEERGMVSSHGSFLGEAFDRLAADSGSHTAIRSEALRSARRYGGRDRRRRLHARIAEAHASIQRTWRRTLPFARSIQIPSVEPEEVRVGKNEPYPVGAAIASATPDAPAVSVIIPTYNRSDRLRRALGSVLDQTFTRFEVLVVDDASTDDTEAVVRSFSDDRVRYLRQRRNRGVSAARNLGLQEARADLIAFLDSDDEWMPDKLRIQVDAFEQHSEQLGLLYTAVEMIRDDGAAAVHRPSHRGDVFEPLLSVNVVYPTSGIMIRRSAAAMVGYFDVDAPANEDWDYWLRLARYCDVDFVADVLVRYSDEANPDRKSLALEDDLAARNRFFLKNAADMRTAGVTAEFLLESVRRHLVPDCWRPRRARALLSEAVRRGPSAPESIRLFARSMLPHRVYMRSRQVWRHLLGRLRHTNELNRTS